MTSAAITWLVTSCVIGIGISWAGFWCQSLVSATTYTVVGVMNKMLTVTVNVLIWDKHASNAGIGSLVLCLVGGSLYQQSPLRSTPAVTHIADDAESDVCIEQDYSETAALKPGRG